MVKIEYLSRNNTMESRQSLVNPDNLLGEGSLNQHLLNTTCIFTVVSLYFLIIGNLPVKYFKFVNCVSIHQNKDIKINGGCKGAPGTCAQPGVTSFIFMQFLGKIWSNNWLALPPWRLVPSLWEILDPSLKMKCFPKS